MKCMLNCILTHSNCNGRIKASTCPTVTLNHVTWRRFHRVSACESGGASLKRLCGSMQFGPEEQFGPTGNFATECFPGIWRSMWFELLSWIVNPYNPGSCKLACRNMCRNLCGLCIGFINSVKATIYYDVIKHSTATGLNTIFLPFLQLLFNHQPSFGGFST